MNIVEICGVEQVKIKCILKVTGELLNVYKGFYYRNNLLSIISPKSFYFSCQFLHFQNKQTNKKVNLILDSRLYRKVTGKNTVLKDRQAQKGRMRLLTNAFIYVSNTEICSQITFKTLCSLYAHPLSNAFLISVTPFPRANKRYSNFSWIYSTWLDKQLCLSSATLLLWQGTIWWIKVHRDCPIFIKDSFTPRHNLGLVFAHLIPRLIPSDEAQEWTQAYLLKMQRLVENLW